jgi:hypothetical protein
MSVDLKGPTLPVLCFKLWQANFGEFQHSSLLHSRNLPMYLPLQPCIRAWDISGLQLPFDLLLQL